MCACLWAKQQRGKHETEEGRKGGEKRRSHRTEQGGGDQRTEVVQLPPREEHLAKQTTAETPAHPVTGLHSTRQAPKERHGTRRGPRKAHPRAGGGHHVALLLRLLLAQAAEGGVDGRGLTQGALEKEAEAEGGSNVRPARPSPCLAGVDSARTEPKRLQKKSVHFPSPQMCETFAPTFKCVIIHVCAI